MNQGAKIKIVSSGGPLGTTVEVDGVILRNVRSVRFEHTAEHVPVVVLEVIALDGAEITGTAEVATEVGPPRSRFGAS